jgi:hypothetical protein
MVSTLSSNFVMAMDGSFVCERLEIERRKSLKLRAQAHERAKLGGQSTKEKWDSDPEGMTARKAQSNGQLRKPS